jgi:hypothetical protein
MLQGAKGATSLPHLAADWANLARRGRWQRTGAQQESRELELELEVQLEVQLKQRCTWRHSSANRSCVNAVS